MDSTRHRSNCIPMLIQESSFDVALNYCIDVRNKI